MAHSLRARPARRVSPTRLALVALGIVTVVAFVLRLVGVDQSLYADEDFTYYIVSRQGLTGIWHRVYDTSITPPLHYYLARFSIRWGGDDTVLIRLPSLILGTALVPLVFVWGRRVGGLRAGLLAAVLIALSPFAIWYSDEARAYATMVFLVVVSTLTLLRALDRGGWRWWAVYAVAACASLWAHYSAVFVIVAQVAWALWVHRERTRELLVAQLAVAVGYLPWVPGFIQQRQNKTGVEIIGQYGPVTFDRVFSLPLRTLIGHPYRHLEVFPGPKGWLILLILVVLLGTAAAMRRLGALRGLGPFLRSEAGLVAILTLATPVGLLLYAAVSSSLWIPRNLSASLPALAVLAGLALAWLTTVVPRALAAAAIAGLVAVLAVNAVDTLGDSYRRPPYREAAEYVAQRASGKDAVVEEPLALQRDQRIPAVTIDRYLDRPLPLFRLGADADAWPRLWSGGRVYVIVPRVLMPAYLVKHDLQGGEKPPPGLLRRLESIGGPNNMALLGEMKVFAGITPVEVARYDLPIAGTLARRGGREVISWSLGKHVLVSPGAAAGSVDVAAPGPPILMTGWALDAARNRPVDWVLFFSRGRLFAVAGMGGRRTDVAKTHGAAAALSGFALSASTPPADRSRIKVFGVVGDRASELPFGAAARRALR